jgi:chloride channel protein, CIC family
MIIELEIERHAPFAGKEVRMLGLPSGVVLIRCFEAGREFVPTASTRLESHTRITAVIAPEAVDGLAILRRGCKGKKLKKP